MGANCQECCKLLDNNFEKVSVDGKVLHALLLNALLVYFVAFSVWLCSDEPGILLYKRETGLV